MYSEEQSVRRFWQGTALAFFLIVLAHLLTPGLTPFRWGPEHLVFLIPLLFGAAVSVIAGTAVTFGSRFISGLIQASTFPAIWRDNNSAFGDE